VNREAEPAEDEGEQQDEQDDTHELISLLCVWPQPGRDPITP
jgi:hypothetical protein